MKKLSCLLVILAVVSICPDAHTKSGSSPVEVKKEEPKKDETKDKNDWDRLTSVKVDTVLKAKAAEPIQHEIDAEFFKVLSSYAGCLSNNSCLKLEVRRFKNGAAKSEAIFYSVHSTYLDVNAKGQEIISIKRSRVANKLSASFDKLFASYKQIKTIALNLDEYYSSGSAYFTISFRGDYPGLKALYGNFLSGGDDDVKEDDELLPVCQ